MTPFFTDYTTFVVDFFFLKSDGARPVVENEECAVEDFFASRYVRETINSFVERCIGIDAATKSNTNRFEIVDEKFVREVFSSIESHVFEEVSKTILVVFFEDSTYGLCDMEFATFFRLIVVTNVISETIVENTHTNIGVDWKRLRQLSH